MITYALIALILGFSVYAFTDPKVMSKYLFSPYAIYHFKEHYRFLTHAFIHGDYIHLGFNLLALWGFGGELENVLLPLLYDDVKIGKLMYLILFTGGIYAASLTEYFRNRNNSSYASLGASGAISSIIFARILIYPKGTIGLFFIPLPGWFVGILLLGISYYLIRRKRNSTYTDTISHEAHFWGAIFGLLFVAVTKPAVISAFISQMF
ncbi:MAG: rhomboid family intramembrane serine protease [Sediminibacterium sp.]|nr:rhomboid family intramembrane serine protease [Sediminibacterium sp.]